MSDSRIIDQKGCATDPHAKDCQRQNQKDWENEKKSELFHLSKITSVQVDDLDYFGYNEQIHSAIHQGAHNQALAEFARDLRLRLSPFRCSTFFKEGNWPHDSSMQHDELIEAILASDADKAFNAMRDHVANSGLNALRYVSESHGE